MSERLTAHFTAKHLIRLFLLSLAIGVSMQVVGFFLLMNSVKFEQGDIKTNQVTASSADLLLTASNFSPHFVIAQALASDSRAVRLVKVADLSAQLLRQSGSVISDFSESEDLGDFLKNKNGASLIQEATINASPLIDSIFELIRGSDNVNDIDRIFGKSIKKPIATLKALADMGRHAELLSGCEKESKFLVLITSSAEARSIGGLIGQYMTLDSNCGDLEIVRVGINTDLKDSMELEKNFKQFPGLYGSSNPEWVNSNLIPDGFEVSQSWIRAYEKQFGEILDGVLVLDTFLLSEFAAIQGGIKSADGTKLAKSAEIDAYLRNGIYFQYPDDQILRKQHLLEISEQLAKSFDFSALTQSEMFPALITAMSEDRILFSLNSKLHTNGGSGHLSWSGENSSTVFIGVNNLSGSKFDFYSKYFVDVEKCNKLNYLIRFKVNNFASNKSVYPDYVARRLDRYHLDKTGVLNQYLFSFDKRSVNVAGDMTPAFSDFRVTRGEKNRNLISVVEFIEANEKYEFTIQLKSHKSLNFRMWGQMLQVSKSESNACGLN